MRISSSSALAAEINVTPLVDVCLVLLIIFMVVTPVLVNGMPVQLPQSATASPLDKEPLLITVYEDRTIDIDGRVLRVDQLGPALEGRPGSRLRPVIVRAAKTLSYGDVIVVLDVCRAAGFEKIGLAAEKRDR